MRAALLALALLVAGCEDADEAATAPPAPVVAAPRPRTATQIKDCRDQCEQAQIVAGRADDSALRACRARCAGSGVGGGGATGPHEVPRSISRSPSLSAPPAVRAVGSATR